MGHLFGAEIDCYTGIDYMLSKHPEIKGIHLGDNTIGATTNVSSSTLRRILSHSNLSQLYLTATSVTGENIETQSDIFSSLKVLGLIKSNFLTDQGFLNILKICGENLTHLDLRETGISGIGISSITLPRLQVLNLSNCLSLSEQGLFEFLSVCSSSLCVLTLDGTDVSIYDITSSALTFPNLKEIYASDCSLYLWGLLTKCHASLKVLQMDAESVSERELSQSDVSFPVLDNLRLYGSVRRGQLYQLLRVFGSNLRVLDLTNVILTDTDAPEYRQKLPKLSCLNLRGSEDIDEDGLCELLKGCRESLSSLNLTDTSISGLELSAFPGVLSNLKSLTLAGCHHLTEEGLNQITRICRTSLKSLDLSRSGISSAELGLILSHEWLELEDLDLEYCEISEIDYIHMTGSTATLSKVKKLNLRNCSRLTDFGLFTILNRCGRGLETLQFNSNHIAGVSLSWFLRTEPHLTELDLSSCKLSSKGLSEFIRVFGHGLKSLRLGGGDKCEDFEEEVLGNLKNLEVLNCTNVYNLTDKGLMVLLSVCGDKLKKLHLSETKVSGVLLATFTKTFPCLEELILDPGSWVTDDGLHNILRICSESVTSLELNCIRLNGEWMPESSVTMPNITTLRLSGEDLTDKGLKRLLRMCGDKLKLLHLDRCPNLGCVSTYQVDGDVFSFRINTRPRLPHREQ